MNPSLLLLCTNYLPAISKVAFDVCLGCPSHQDHYRQDEKRHGSSDSSKDGQVK